MKSLLSQKNVYLRKKGQKKEKKNDSWQERRLRVVFFIASVLRCGNIEFRFARTS